MGCFKYPRHWICHVRTVEDILKDIIQSPRINLAPSKLNWMRLGEIIVIKIQNNSAQLYKDHVLAKRCSQNLATPGFNVNMTYYGINNWRCNDVMGKWVKLYLRCPPYSLRT